MIWDIKAGCMGKRRLQLGNLPNLNLFYRKNVLAEKEGAIYLLSFFPDIQLDVNTFLVERNRVQDTLWPTVTLLPGVHKLVHHLKTHNVPMAIATSSRCRNYHLKTAHLQSVLECFEGKVVCGDDHQYKMRGKPAPDIFIATAWEMLNRDVGYPKVSRTDKQIDECRKGLVFEDALPGLQAGKRAGMSGMTLLL